MRDDDPAPQREDAGTGSPRVPPEAIAAGLILAAVALGFAVAPSIVAWADGVSPGLGFWVGLLLAIALGGGFIGVFWLRGRARRKAE